MQESAAGPGAEGEVRGPVQRTAKLGDTHMEGVLEGKSQRSHKCNTFGLKTEAESALNRAEMSSGVAVFVEQQVACVCVHLKNRDSPLHSQNI